MANYLTGILPLIAGQGWDIIFETPHRMPAWCRLAKKKWMGGGDGESNITREDFDALLGHAVAVTDAAASVFAAEMIAAYPEAKVVLNSRRDEDAWHSSVIANIASAGESWNIYMTSWFTAHGYWTWMVYGVYLWGLLFRTSDGNPSHAIRRNGKWIKREHENMIRGLVPKENLLEWSVEDGWEPLCKFLGKPVPSEPFPNTNNAEGFQQRLVDWMTMQNRRLRRNVMITSSVLIGGLGLMSWKLAPNQLTGAARRLQSSLSEFRR